MPYERDARGRDPPRRRSCCTTLPRRSEPPAERVANINVDRSTPPDASEKTINLGTEKRSASRARPDGFFFLGRLCTSLRLGKRRAENSFDGRQHVADDARNPTTPPKPHAFTSARDEKRPLVVATRTQGIPCRRAVRKLDGVTGSQLNRGAHLRSWVYVVKSPSRLPGQGLYIGSPYRRDFDVLLDGEGGFLLNWIRI